MKLTRLWMLPVIGLVAIMLAGCPPQTAQNPEDERVAGTEERREEATEVQVSLTEFAIGMNPETAPAGDVIFNVRNDGDAVHAFEVEGQGVEQETPNLQPGETATLRINNMQPGAYEVYCPVGNHEERGMRDTFTVTEAAR